MVTRSWKVYGKEGHRMAQSFGKSECHDWSRGDDKRIIVIIREDLTHSNDFCYIMITRNTAKECKDELRGQLSDGLFENCRYGKVEELLPKKGD